MKQASESFSLGPQRGALPPLSAAGTFTIGVDAAGVAMLSINGGAYAPIGTGVVAAGWTDDGGTVRLTTVTDVVSIGDPVAPADTKLYVEYTATTDAGAAIRADLLGDVSGAAAISATLQRNADVAALDPPLGCIEATPVARAGDTGAITAFVANPPGGVVASPVVAFEARGSRAGPNYGADFMAVDHDAFFQAATITAGNAFACWLQGGFAILNGAGGVCRCAGGSAESTDAAARRGGDVELLPGLGGGAGAPGTVVCSEGNVVGAVPQASALLECQSVTRGFLPPKMTTAQRDAIVAPTAGLLIFNTTTNKLNVRGGAAWEAVTSV